MPGQRIDRSADRTSVETVYCFDFDGVLCDSMDETLVTSYNAYFNGDAKGLSDIDPAFRNFFYGHRHLVRPAGEFYVLYHAFQMGENVIGKDRFLQLRDDLAHGIKNLAERFYPHRNRLQSDLECWECLHKTYPQCAGFLKNRSHRFFVVTNKDRDSVISLARHFGYLDRIAGVYSREISLNKRILMEKLIEDKGLNPSTRRTVYVDDHEGTLREMKGLQLDLYLASWGYTGEPGSGSFKLLHALDELP